jgi:hypothetical protein
VVRNALLMLPMGCAAHERVMRVDGDALNFSRFADLPPKTFFRWDVEPDGRTLSALIQLGYRGAWYGQVPVEAEHLTLFTYRQEGADFWGRSMLRAAYTHYYAKLMLYRIRGIGAEKSSVGIPCVTLGAGASSEDRATAVAYVTAIAAHQRTGLVLPNGATFKIHGVEGSVFDSMEDIVHHNEQISFVALDFFSNLGRGGKSGAGGNRALQSGQGKFFQLALQNAADYVAQRITDSDLAAWTAFNYGPDAPVPRLAAANVQSRGFEEVMGVLTEAAQAGLVVSDQPLRDQVRAEAGFDQETRDGIVAVKGETIDLGSGTEISGRSAGEIATGGGSQGQQEAGGGGQKTVGGPQQAGGGGENEPAAAPVPAPAKKGPPPATASRQKESARLSERPAGRARTVPSQFWKEGHDPALKNVHPTERHVDFPGHQRELDAAEAELERTLKGTKRKIVRGMAEKAAAAVKGGASPASLAFSVPEGLKEAVQPLTARVYRHFRGQVRVEHGRLRWGGPAALGEQTLQDQGADASDVPGLIAEIAAEGYTSELGQALKRSMLRLRADQTVDLSSLSKSEIADLLYDGVIAPGTGIPAVSDNLEGNIAAGAVRGAFRRGRSDEAQQIIDEMGRQGVPVRMIRVAVLDKNVCGPCADADGQPWPPDVPVNSICEGGDLCRCEPIEEAF